MVGIRGSEWYDRMQESNLHKVLFTYYLHTVRAFTKLITLLQLTLLLGIPLLRYLGASGLT
jgi:hypothetical protein